MSSFDYLIVSFHFILPLKYSETDELLCYQPILKGDCNEDHPRYGFDAYAGKCQPFRYTGCDKNDNNFATEEACMNRCPNKLRCEHPILNGYGDRRDFRFAFNSTRGKCQSYIYRGYYQNPNSFPTEDECHSHCPMDEMICYQPILKGECGNYESRYAFDPRKGNCQPFTYSGCGGNDNNFLSKESCKKNCPSKGVCAQPIVVGACSDYQVRYAFNSMTGKCLLFSYGGCGGTANNFDSMEDCLHYCPKNYDCYEPLLEGYGSNGWSAYGFNPTTGKCEKYGYSGFGGTANNFGTMEDCLRNCPSKSGSKLS